MHCHAERKPETRKKEKKKEKEKKEKEKRSSVFNTTEWGSSVLGPLVAFVLFFVSYCLGISSVKKSRRCLSFFHGELLSFMMELKCIHCRPYVPRIPSRFPVTTLQHFRIYASVPTDESQEYMHNAGRGLLLIALRVI